MLWIMYEYTGFFYLFIYSFQNFEIISFWFPHKQIYTWKKKSQFFNPKSDKICLFEAFIPTHFLQDLLPIATNLLGKRMEWMNRDTHPWHLGWNLISLHWKKLKSIN
jgi:hypothetical protein